MLAGNRNKGADCAIARRLLLVLDLSLPSRDLTLAMISGERSSRFCDLLDGIGLGLDTHVNHVHITFRVNDRETEGLHGRTGAAACAEVLGFPWRGSVLPA